jgi:hypothetical protein
MRAMRALLLVSLVVSGCGGGGGSDFQVPPGPDGHFTLDLAFTPADLAADGGCFNTACGGCSSWARFDGTPVQVGDPCLWSGQWQCSGTMLQCSNNGCPSCGSHMTGSVCGADGHTIVELTYVGSTCSAYDFGSAIAVCAAGCLGRCVMTNGEYQCSAGCVDADAGTTGCPHAATDSCTSLAGC